MAFLDQFHYKITGPESGRRWVFLHGLLGSINNWGSIVRQLEKTECCLVYDQRGHGRSMKPATGYSPWDYAEDLKKIVDELGWENFVLVGHSLGGRNSYHFAAENPHRVSHLIIEDIGPEADPQSSLYFEKLLGVIPTPFASKEAAKSFFENEFSRVFKTREDPKVLSGFLQANLTENSQGQIEWRFSPTAILQSAREGRAEESWNLIEKLKMPTLWIRGENSKELSPETYERILKSNSMIQGVVIPRAGHWVHFENREDFLTQIKSFVGVS